MDVAYPLLDNFMAGNNGTLFSYGVTNAGKIKKMTKIFTLILHLKTTKKKVKLIPFLEMMITPESCQDV